VCCSCPPTARARGTRAGWADERSRLLSAFSLVVQLTGSVCTRRQPGFEASWLQLHANSGRNNQSRGQGPRRGRPESQRMCARACVLGRGLSAEHDLLVGGYRACVDGIELVLGPQPDRQVPAIRADAGPCLQVASVSHGLSGIQIVVSSLCKLACSRWARVNLELLEAQCQHRLRLFACAEVMDVLRARGGSAPGRLASLRLVSHPGSRPGPRCPALSGAWLAWAYPQLNHSSGGSTQWAWGCPQLVGWGGQSKWGEAPEPPIALLASSPPLANSPHNPPRASTPKSAVSVGNRSVAAEPTPFIFLLLVPMAV